MKALRHPVRSPSSSARARRRGATVVEAAVVVPLFFMLVIGIIEFGRAMSVSQLITSAARTAARKSALSNDNEAVATSVKDFCEQTLGIDRGLINVTVSVTPGADNPNPNPSGDLALAQQGDRCSVNVTVPVSAVSYAIPQFLSGQSLAATCVMEHE